MKTSISIDRYSDIVSQVSMSCIGGLAFNKKRARVSSTVSYDKEKIFKDIHQTVSVLCDMGTVMHLKKS